jgi:hypothetical protein
MEKRNVEIWYCKGCGPVTRVSSCHPGLRRGAQWRPRWRSDGRRRVSRCSNKHRLRRTEQRCCGPLRPALGVLRPGVRKVHGRRWSVASLRIKPKRSGSSRSFLCPTLSMLDIGWSTLRAPGFTSFRRVGGPRTTCDEPIAVAHFWLWIQSARGLSDEIHVCAAFSDLPSTIVAVYLSPHSFGTDHIREGAV